MMEMISTGQSWLGTARCSFKAVEIVADGHGKSQEFFKRLLGLLEFDRDVAGFQAHARRQVIKLLLEDCVLSFDQKLRFAQTILTRAVISAATFRRRRIS